MRSVEIVQLLAEENRRRLERFSGTAGLLLAALGVLLFWGGSVFLRESVFKHWFNPTRHVVVDQDPVTGEIFAWKDSLDHVYTREDPHVRYFPYACTALILLLLGLGVMGHRLLVEHYALILVLVQERLWEEARAGPWEVPSGLACRAERGRPLA
ncbi:MAG: hypothetical protein H5T97_12235 [Firmicutes bacterium]|nr:hypothetical protein [Bacillota bacterium]